MCKAYRCLQYVCMLLRGGSKMGVPWPPLTSSTFCRPSGDSPWREHRRRRSCSPDFHRRQLHRHPSCLSWHSQSPHPEAKKMAGVVKHKMTSHAWPFIPCKLHLRELSCYAGVCGAVHIQTSCIHLPAHSYTFNLSGRSCVRNQLFRQIATGIAHIGTCIESLKRSLVAPMNFLESTWHIKQSTKQSCYACMNISAHPQTGWLGQQLIDNLTYDSSSYIII